MTGAIFVIGLWAVPLAFGPENPEASRHAQRGLQLAQQRELGGAEAELRQAVQLVPNDSEYLSELGSVLGMEQKLEESLTYFEKALRLDPQNIVIRRNLASSQWQLGKFAEAKQNLEFILKSKPHDPPSMLLLGMVAENLKDYATAAQLLGAVPALVNQRPESIAALARSYYRTGERDKARATLDALLRHAAGPAGVFLAGQVAADSEDYEMAERLLQSIRATYPDPAALGYNLALVQYRQGRYEDCFKTLVGLTEAGHRTSDIYNLLAWCYHKEKKPKEAWAAFEQAIDLDPRKETNYLDLGMVLVEEKRFPAALAIAKQAVEILPTSENLYKLKGMVELKLQHYNDSVQSYSRAVELDPDSSEASLGLALAEWNSGLSSEARATFERGLKRFPRDPLHYTEYARMLLKFAEAGDRAAETRAVLLLQTAITLDGSKSEARYQLGDYWLAKGKIQEACDELETAAKLEPRASKIHYSLARAYRRLGRKDEEAREFELYQNLKSEEEKSTGQM